MTIEENKEEETVSQEDTAEEETVAEETGDEGSAEAVSEVTVEGEKTEEENKEEDEEIHKIEVSQPSNVEAIVEGLLYVVGEDGVRIEQLAMVIEKSLEDTKTILENIQRKYAEEIYGIELVGYGSVYKFITKSAVYPYAQALFGSAKQNTLSQAALETLAIIAYKQPITRVEIEELRGVSAEVMLRKLQARNLIREAGRSEAVGRPILYEVTEEFMDSFKLYTLNELPDLPEYNQSDENENLFE
ncbi:MAG: SMC-Scp complex subunit ScpB [Erysipelotrichaceae bacterium]|nr:SMC-Scp complex subunit ScpB [Erysipelotrichaceae bacterium]